jgi:hypothetical protein
VIDKSAVSLYLMAIELSITDVSVLGSLSDQIKRFFTSYAATCLINQLLFHLSLHRARQGVFQSLGQAQNHERAQRAPGVAAVAF